MDTPIIPSNFLHWQHCIVHECGIALEKSFIEERIAALSNINNQQTKQFIRLYGETQHKQTLQWFNQALLETV